MPRPVPNAGKNRGRPYFAGPLSRSSFSPMNSNENVADGSARVARSANILSYRSSGSILSIGSKDSILSVGSAGSLLST